MKNGINRAAGRGERRIPICGNCHSRVDANDKYCRICGTKIGDDYIHPSSQLMQCIYGPMPVERTHVCEKCGYTWTTCLMIDSEKFCPKCGGRAPATTKDGIPTDTDD